MALAAGTTLGPYEILSLIGAGGMGEVYRARDPRLGRDVAIKVLPADRVADEDRRRRFVQEAKAASALNHPHIVTIHEIESANGADFIVMEYVRGKSLEVDKRGVPTLRNRLARVPLPQRRANARHVREGVLVVRSCPSHLGRQVSRSSSMASLRRSERRFCRRFLSTPRPRSMRTSRRPSARSRIERSTHAGSPAR
jgi:serine/threonine protein kinase